MIFQARAKSEIDEVVERFNDELSAISTIYKASVNTTTTNDSNRNIIFGVI